MFWVGLIVFCVVGTVVAHYAIIYCNFTPRKTGIAKIDKVLDVLCSPDLDVPSFKDGYDDDHA